MAKHTKKEKSQKTPETGLTPPNPETFLNQPADKYVKYIFGITEVSSEFVQFALPEAIQSVLDISTLKKEDTSYIDEKLKAQFSDVVLSVRALVGLDMTCHLILEHKSKKSSTPVAPQLLRYSSASYSNDILQKRPLRPTIPILLYHGEEDYPKETLLQLFPGIPEALKTYIPNFDYILVNIKSVPDEIIENLPFLFLPNILFVLKYGKSKAGIVAYFEKMLIFAEDNADLANLMNLATLYYLTANSNFKLEDMETLVNEMPAKKAKIVKGTLFDVMNQRELKGELKGKLEGKLEVVKALILSLPDKSDQEIAQLAQVELQLVVEARASLKK